MESFSIVKRGYDPQEVDEYIETLEKVVKSYKDKDNAIKNAIISAQVAADNILRNSHAESTKHRNQTFSQLQNIYDSIELQRSRVQEFQEEYNSLINKYLAFTESSNNDIGLIFERIDELEDLLREISENIDSDEDDDYNDN